MNLVTVTVLDETHAPHTESNYRWVLPGPEFIPSIKKSHTLLPLTPTCTGPAQKHQALVRNVVKEPGQ